MCSLNIALLVSSDENIRHIFPRLFEKANVNYVLEQEDTRALVRLLEMETSLLVIDLDSDPVKGMDFLDLVKRLRPRLPIIVVLSSESETVHEQMKAAGALCCLVKPVREKHAKEWLDSACHCRHQ